MSLLKLLCGQADDSDSSASRTPRQRRQCKRSSGGRRRRHSRSTRIDDVKLLGQLVEQHGRYVVNPFPASSKHVDPKDSADIKRALSVIAGRPIAWKREREDRTTRIGDILAFFVDIRQADGIKVYRYTSETFRDPRKYPRQAERPRTATERPKRHRPAPSVSTATASAHSSSSSRSSSSASTATTSPCTTTTSSEQSKPSDATFTTSSTEIRPPTTLLRAWRKGHVTTLAGYVLNSPIPRKVPGSIRVTNVVTASTETKARLKQACPFDLAFPYDKTAIAAGERVVFELRRASGDHEHLQAINVRISNESGDQVARESGPRLVGKVIRLPSNLYANMNEAGWQPGVLIVKDVADIEDHIASRRKGPQKHIDLSAEAQTKYKERQYGWMYADSKEPNGLDHVTTGDLLAFNVIQGDYAGAIELVMISRPPDATPSKPASVPAPSVVSPSSSETSASHTVSSAATATTSQSATTATIATPIQQTSHHSRRSSHMSRKNSLRGEPRRNSHRLS